MTEAGTENSEEERELLSREKAEEIAKSHRKKPDPFDDIQPSLLSAEHIKKYVLKTGLISPFFEGGGGSSRLKKASYEGRIGTCAYMFDKVGQLVSISTKDNLVVPPNSIVFVECDLDFRLPEYMALRFNLQIRHVHRGLLLGTGPLVDPGYWGKLCIPLHNLTDEAYEIPLSEGLIWVEFTKTTSDLNGKDPIGRRPLDREFWNIRDFIEKAASPFNKELNPVAIRSSIPLMVSEANNRSESALKKTEEAVRSANEAAKSAKDAGDTASQIRRVSILAGIGVVIGVVSVWGTYFYGMTTQYDTVRLRLDQIQRDVAGNVRIIDGVSQHDDKAKSEISTVLDELRKAGSRISGLEEDNRKLISRILELESVLKSQSSDSSKPE